MARNRIICYILVAIIGYVLFSCDQNTENTFQHNNLVSPNDLYKVKFEIKTFENNHKYWTFIVQNTESGKTEFEFSKYLFVGNLNIYWNWDEKNILWIHNSDDGQFWNCRKEEGNWILIKVDRNQYLEGKILLDLKK